MEVPSPASGAVKEVKVKVGDRVSEGDLIVLLEAGEAKSKVEPPSPEGVQESDAHPIEAPETPKDTRRRGRPRPRPGPTAGQGRSRACMPARACGASRGSSGSTSPRSRAAARRAGSPRTTSRRILQAARRRLRPAAGGGIPEIPPVDFAKFGEIEQVPLSRIKKISGPHLHRGWLNVPQVTQHDEADITELEPYRKELDGAAREQGYRITLLAFLIKAAVSALQRFPDVNASLAPDKQNLIRKKYVHIGIAVDTPDGLVVPVLRDVDRKGIEALSRELGEISQKARDGKLASADLQGASFTISSLGGIGGTGFTPLVNAPEVAILGVVRAKMAPLWDGAQFVPRLMLPVALSYDHRVVDGALAARFTRHLCHVLEDVRRLVL